MRKTLASIAFVLCAVAASAEVVSESAAKVVAGEFFYRNVKTAGAAASKLQLVASSREICAGSKFMTSVTVQDPTYYVYNNSDGGFVIVAGDDCAERILAYSHEGSFVTENMPENLRWWMSKMDEQIAAGRSAGLDRHPSWNAGIRPMANTVVKYETAQWNQTSPYSDEVTAKVAKGYVTGCVATAAAIVLRFHEWPNAGTGTIPAYTTRSTRKSIPANTLGREYKYSLMPLKTSEYRTAEQKAQVAALMYDIGTAVEMDYGQSSGAYTEDLCDALKTYFGYGASATLKYKDYSGVSEATWIRMLQDELKNNGPIIYGGLDHGSSGADAGHQFVFDGYDDENKFSVNWGWGGSANGWFTVATLGDRSSVGYIFSYQQDAILNLVPYKIADHVSFAYSAASRKITLTADGMDMNYEFVGLASGVRISGALTSGKSVDIDTSTFAAGAYTLTLSKGTVKHTVTIKL